MPLPVAVGVDDRCLILVRTAAGRVGVGGGGVARIGNEWIGGEIGHGAPELVDHHRDQTPLFGA
ncbi:MAG: hypothetical protein HRT86_09250 [Ilumatobacteraceae bacterium]|nr:hypothetical protein [Ilumatobacteraceae bacterium]